MSYQTKFVNKNFRPGFCGSIPNCKTATAKLDKIQMM